MNVEVEWKKGINSAYSSRRTPDWVKGLQKYHDDILKSFTGFPSDVAVPSRSMVAEFREFLVENIDYTNSKSKILSSGANKILSVLSVVNIRDLAAQGILNEFHRMLPILMIAYRRITTDLTPIIGSAFKNEVNNALSDTEAAFERFVKIFRGNGICFEDNVDYTPVLAVVKKLVDTIELRGDVTLSKSQLETQNVQDALVILRSYLHHITICVQGLSVSSSVILLEQKSNPACN